MDPSRLPSHTVGVECRLNNEEDAEQHEICCFVFCLEVEWVIWCIQTNRLSDVVGFSE